MRFILLILLVPFIAAAQPTDYSNSVLYGERNGLAELPDTYRIFVDRNGDLYPGQTLPDSLVSAADASLAKLYERRPDLFPTAQPSFAAYQDSLLQANLHVINRLAANNTDVFAFVHGFRKPFRPVAGGRTAQSEYLLLQQRIRNAAPDTTRPFFIEIYWDATYDCCFGFKAKQNRALFQLFELQAQRHASVAGYRLRPLLAGITTDKLHLIGHSLGTRLVVTAAFNAYADDVAQELRAEATPGQPLVDICLIGPAIAGSAFEHYYLRGNKELSNQDNYHLSIFYNRKDFVLKKRVFIFGPGPRRYGDTSLGADRRRSVAKLSELFSEVYPGSGLSPYRVSIGKSHALRHYSGTEEFRTYLGGLW
ncbi:hypothetical protein FUA23_19295 [Neolewinella aurantiaca]|uniref:Alpha/beta hydrolase family protein DUF900 n=1 Tax=Neolewinella aurantiaca TaxID=2602767 RepID=A0A5C7F7H4_9BACT|nr:hypothetical protein [Neolewinella aurantiaca]TXF86651.1 hypothetical protein FUA23_19295 [Neolewinella aurantiaca]